MNDVDTTDNDYHCSSYQTMSDAHSRERLEGSRPRMCTRLQKAPTVARNRSKNISDCFSVTCIRASFCPNFLLYGHLYYISGKLYYYGQSSGKIGLVSGNRSAIRAKYKRLNFSLLQIFGHPWAWSGADSLVRARKRAEKPSIRKRPKRFTAAGSQQKIITTIKL